MSGPDTQPLVSVYANTPAERVAASRVVLRRARSREDLHELLDALGLNTTSSNDTSEGDA